jgi:AraC family transcriptional regulator, regulatory protein of adaptative response / methylated-DNA-[protein]-cysteine methyltransferase
MDDFIAKARAHLDTRNGDRVTLAELAASVGVSPFHLQRRFKAALGLSPHDYQAALRLEAVKAALNGLRVRYCCFRTGIGAVLVAATARGLCAVKLGASAEALETMLKEELGRAQLIEDPEKLARFRDAIVAFLEGEASLARLPLDVRGTVFQRRVWDALKRIPRGETRSYAQIAAELGAPAAVRAVGSACGANPVALAVPCHRVLRSDGALGGYAWGLERKKKLLELERAVPQVKKRASGRRQVRPDSP